jgi:hypothetical protein
VANPVSLGPAMYVTLLKTSGNSDLTLSGRLLNHFNLRIIKQEIACDVRR